jgi:hypothetical protein
MYPVSECAPPAALPADIDVEPPGLQPLVFTDAKFGFTKGFTV